MIERMTESEAIERLEYLANKADVALATTKCNCSWAKESVKGTITALEMAIKALEKQIPKKPKEFEDKYYACPVCKNPLMHKWKKYNTELMEKYKGLPVCLNCLQTIDWSDENERSI